MKWFKNIETLDQLKKEYRKLAIKHHPDKGGSTVFMQEINNEYDILSKKLIDGNPDFSDYRKTYEHNVSDAYKEKISKVINLEGVFVEIIGSWIWLTGETRENKDEIKNAGFKYSPNKIAWYWYHGRYRKFNNKQYDMNDIRQTFGSQRVSKDEDSKQNHSKSKTKSFQS